jgi:maleylacetoacetate isomerase
MARHGASLTGGEDALGAWMRRFMTPGLLATEKLLEIRPAEPFSHGADVTLADICIVPQLYNALRWDVPLDAMPRLRRIYNAALELPEFAAAAPQLPEH